MLYELVDAVALVVVAWKEAVECTIASNLSLREAVPGAASTMQHSLGGAFEIPLTLVGSVSSSLGVWYAHQGHRKRCCGSPGCSILYNRHGSGSDRSNKQCLQLLGVRLTDVSSSLPSADVNPGVSTTLRQLGEACGEQSYTYLFDPIQH